MKVLRAKNVHEALYLGMDFFSWGVGDDRVTRRESRNGPVLVANEPVTTVYELPTQRVEFHADRDSNPFFHLMESLWMLQGRDDVAFPASFAKQIREYSDDGKLLHGAYGRRWRTFFGVDQIQEIIDGLKSRPDCRRQVLQMWSPLEDLGRDGKDVPCNLTAHFQLDVDGRLDMTVFCRSNDAIWGAYGANAVHFSVLQEYIASALARPVGRYWQVSDNLHVYDNELYRGVRRIAKQTQSRPYDDPRISGHQVPLMSKSQADWDRDLDIFMTTGVVRDTADPFFRDVVRPMYEAHRILRSDVRPEAFRAAGKELMKCKAGDWRIAAQGWVDRREVNWVIKNEEKNAN